MKAPARLGLYGLVLVAVFAVAGFTANAVIPEETVQSWAEDTAQNTHHDEGDNMDGACPRFLDTQNPAPGAGEAR